jgi:hypothetical protein
VSTLAAPLALPRYAELRTFDPQKYRLEQFEDAQLLYEDLLASAETVRIGHIPQFDM